MGVDLICLGETSINKFRARFRLDLDDLEAKSYVDQLIYRSYNNTSTRFYDSFQYKTNAIPY
jgi:phosphatidylinositol kinase/protein kinase (PI-3  family)